MPQWFFQHTFPKDHYRVVFFTRNQNLRKQGLYVSDIHDNGITTWQLNLEIPDEYDCLPPENPFGGEARGTFFFLLIFCFFPPNFSHDLD